MPVNAPPVHRPREPARKLEEERRAQRHAAVRDGLFQRQKRGRGNLVCGGGPTRGAARTAALAVASAPASCLRRQEVAGTPVRDSLKVCKRRVEWTGTAKFPRPKTFGPRTS